MESVGAAHGRLRAQNRALSSMQWKQAIPLLVLLLCREAVVISAQAGSTTINESKNYSIPTSSGPISVQLTFTGNGALYTGVAEVTFPAALNPNDYEIFDVQFVAPPQCGTCEPIDVSIPFHGTAVVSGQKATWTQDFTDPSGSGSTRRLLIVPVILAIGAVLIGLVAVGATIKVKVTPPPGSVIPPISVEITPPGHKGDPKFQGFDGSVFWFHGKRDSSWCLISDKELHINAYFNGKSALEGPRLKYPHDLTWVQKLVFLFGKHTLIVSAIQEPGWTKELDHLDITFDGESISLPPFSRNAMPHAESWTSLETVYPKVTLMRNNVRNQMTVQVEGLVESYIKVIPTKPETWTKDSSFAHIDATYNLLRPTSTADGVLGRTAFSKNNGDMAAPYILWNLDDYSTSDLASPDCKVSRFGPSIVAKTIEDESDLDSGSATSVQISCSGISGLVCR